MNEMAHWIIDDHGFGGSWYRCSKCGSSHWDILDDVCGEEFCPDCGATIDWDANVYMRNGRVEK